MGWRMKDKPTLLCPFLGWPRIICLDIGHCLNPGGGLPNKFINNDPEETNQGCVANLYHALSLGKMTITLVQLHLEFQSLSFSSLVLSTHNLDLFV